jgi:predicted XRE-type DNA-binding protein
MRYRCTNPVSKDWKKYGGRGVTVSERWDDFTNFLADMGERPTGMTIDRIDNSGNYEPDNCRWATPSQQQQNRAATRLTPANRAAIIADQRKQQEIAAAYGIDQSYVSHLKRGRRR